MKRLGLALLAVGAALAACNSEDVGHLQNDTRQLAQHAGQAIGSAGVAGKVYTALSLRKGVDVKGLHVEAKDDVVTIGGHVSSNQEKQTVLETAGQTTGVTTVIDQIKVVP